MNLKTTIPPRIWPALALLGLFLVGTEMRQIAVWLAVVVVPFTLVSVWMTFLRGSHSANVTKKLTILSIGIRLGVSLVFAFTALILLTPSRCIIYKFQGASDQVRNAAELLSFSSLSPKTAGMIPRGETTLAQLPKMLRGVSAGVDPWGNAIMVIAEDRIGGLWLGAYSKGRDGVSNSKGNDPDDLNSWGQEGYELYHSEIQREELLRVLGMMLVLFVCFLPLCFGVFVPEVRGKAA